MKTGYEQLTFFIDTIKGNNELDAFDELQILQKFEKYCFLFLGDKNKFRDCCINDMKLEQISEKCKTLVLLLEIETPRMDIIEYSIGLQKGVSRISFFRQYSFEKFEEERKRKVYKYLGVGIATKDLRYTISFLTTKMAKTLEAISDKIPISEEWE